jgi:hypothetical protein
MSNGMLPLDCKTVDEALSFAIVCARIRAGHAYRENEGEEGERRSDSAHRMMLHRVRRNSGIFEPLPKGTLRRKVVYGSPNDRK